MSMIMGAGPSRPIVGGLPSGPKSGFNNANAHAANGSMSISNPMGLRKPPSLSTLAMPSFSVPPPSQTLTATIRKLVAQLPRENRDLARTVVELIQATSKEVKETKMPLSNLLVVFTPSLNMSPSLLRVLCEAEGVWVDEERVIDIRRRTVIIGPSPDAVVPATAEDAEEKKEKTYEVDVEEEEGSVISGSGRASLDTTDNSLSSEYHASVEDDTSSSLSMPVPVKLEEQQGEEVSRLRHGVDYERTDVPTVYMSTKSHCSTASSISSRDEDEEAELEQVPTATPQVNSFANRDRDRDCPHHQHHQRYMADDALSMLSMSSSPPVPVLLSSSVESVVTPTSSVNSSLAELINEDQRQKKETDGAVGPPKIAETTPLELRPQGMAGTVLFPSQQSQQSMKPTQLPFASASSTSLAAKRRSIPTLSMPSLSPLAVAYAPSPSSASSSAPTPSSASASHRSFGEKEKDAERKTLRAKKPS
ncbi:hypothetical protein CPB84DRAFT_384457 [Gymnopilus junonius]|uniref:Rho-GAP domain-containing protein n=1 Tax=Gymnopilus junonius TaxID=109634 RepID=A0A9P5NBQ2_GYMJU|nr:hypothetical protein CPB84DRAFT_384457 [Gymnopilus junonius]